MDSDLEIRCTVIVCDLRFPRNVLLGIDFLMRTTFAFSNSQHDHAYLTFEGREFLMNYSDNRLLQLSLVSLAQRAVMSIQVGSSPCDLVPLPDTPTAVHLHQTTELPHIVAISWRALRVDLALLMVTSYSCTSYAVYLLLQPDTGALCGQSTTWQSHFV